MEEKELKESIDKAVELGISDQNLLENCKKLLDKKIAERILIEKIINATKIPSITSPYSILNKENDIVPLEELLNQGTLLKPYDSKSIENILLSLDLLLTLRKLFMERNVDQLDEILHKTDKIKNLPETIELNNIRKFVENDKEGKILLAKMKLAIKNKNKDQIVDLIAQGKLIKYHWEKELFAQAIDLLKRLAEIDYYREKAKQEKNIGIIEMAIKKIEENDPNDPDLALLKKYIRIIIEIKEECLIALNVLDKTLMENVINKAKTIDYYHDLIDTLNMLLNEMDEGSFQELQYKAALRLGDKTILLQRTLINKKKEICDIPKAEEVYCLEKCPIIQDSAVWAKKSFIADVFGSTERQKSFLVWTKVPIHKPITKINDKKLVEEAQETFKNILCYMGDKEHSSPTSCAQALVYSGLHNESLRDEIYVQLMKQLTENKNLISWGKGWNLMIYCLKAFSPIVTQNYLDYFIRTKAFFPEQILVVMYTKILFESKVHLQLNEIRAMVA